MVSPLFRFLAAWGLLVASMPLAAEDPAFIPGTELRVPGERPFVECPGLVPQFRRWSRELGLESWHVRLVCGMHPDYEGWLVGLSVRSPALLRRATIWIAPRLGPMQERVVIHELAHLMAGDDRFASRDAEEAWVQSLERTLYRNHRRRLAARATELRRAPRRGEVTPLRPSRPETTRPDPSRPEPGRVEPSLAGPSRTGQGRR